jgi:hypothetical protein
MRKRISLVEAHSNPRIKSENEYKFTFSVEDIEYIDTEEVNKKRSLHQIKVSITATMQALWQIKQPNIDFEKACYVYGKDEIISLLKNQMLLDKQNLEILSTTHSKECPFNTDNIIYKIGDSENLDIQ